MMVQQDLKVHKVFKENKVLLDHKVFKVKQEPKVFKDLLELMELMV